MRVGNLNCMTSPEPEVLLTHEQGLAFDALQQCFRPADIDAVMDSTPDTFPWKQQVYVVIDPAAGGPQSDFALVSFYRHKGIVTVKHCTK